MSRNYIVHYESNATMTMKLKDWMDSQLFLSWMAHMLWNRWFLQWIGFFLQTNIFKSSIMQLNIFNNPKKHYSNGFGWKMVDLTCEQVMIIYKEKRFVIKTINFVAFELVLSVLWFLIYELSKCICMFFIHIHVNVSA
jgi:hypothetical protein